MRPLSVLLVSRQLSPTLRFAAWTQFESVWQLRHSRLLTPVRSYEAVALAGAVLVRVELRFVRV